ncbi:MAG: hypothetical protein ACRDA3_16250 [Peptostreptococcaceae bacterium]
MKQSNLTSKAQQEVTNYAVGNLTNNSSPMAQDMQAEAMQNLTNSMQNEAIANLNNEAMANKVVKKSSKKSSNQQSGMF